VKDKFTVNNINNCTMPDNEKLYEYLHGNSYRSERYKLFYVATPKVACTTLKWWFAALEGYSQTLRGITESAESDPDLVIHDTFHKVAKNVTRLMQEPLSEALTSDEYFRFAVVRNPYKRLFSAWQSKLLLQEPLQIGPYIKYDFFNHPINCVGDIATAFEGFLEHLASNEAPSYWDYHWTPQATLLRPDLINYSKLIKIENPEELSKALADGRGEYLPNPFTGRRTNESLIPYFPELVTARSAELICTLYAEDFDIFGYDKQPPKIKETFSAEQIDVAIKAIKLIRARHQRLGERNVQIASINQAVTERDSQISSLNQAMTERDNQIADLHRTVAERDGEISSFSQVVSQCDDEISSLNQAVAERDVQISGLNRAVAERDTQITDLYRAVSERDDQISSFSQAVSERDDQISKLSQIVAERDGQVGNLSQVVADKDDQILNLKEDADHILTEKSREDYAVQQELNSILHSRSWRATAFLRKGVTTVRQAVQSTRLFFLEKIPKRLLIRCDLLIGSAVRQIRDSALFDADYYLVCNPDVRNSGLDPVTHYLHHGWRELRNPSHVFSTSQYLSDNPDVARAQINPLIHYLRFGQQEGRAIALLAARSDIDTVHSVSTFHEDLVAVSDMPTTFEDDLLEVGDLPIQNESEHVSNATIDSEVEVIRTSGLFDESFYRSMNRDLQLLPGEAIKHYCEYGWREGRNPSDDFDTNFYLATYSDISNAGLNPFWHYVVAGAREMRHAVPDLATRYESNTQFGNVDSDIRLIALYASPNWEPLHKSRPLFKNHSQRALPHDDFGYYDLVNNSVLKKQSELAKRHGLYGFCFDLELGDAGGNSSPAQSFMELNDIEFRFCLRIALPDEDDLAPMVGMILRAVSDCRYIRIADRPLILISTPDKSQHIASALGKLRQRLADQGVDNVFLMGQPESVCDIESTLVDPWDAMLDLPSDPVPAETGDFLPQEKNGINVVPYSVIATQGIMRTRKLRSSIDPLYHAVTLGRDNTAQKTEHPLVYSRFHVRDYRRWLDAAIASARDVHPENRRFVFVNGWNNWNDGLFLEPDQHGGYCRLNETTRALLNIASGPAMPKVSVIVPNYNHEPYLRRRLDSIYGQTYKNIEVILMDDCSTDQSRTLIEQYAKQYPEITRTLFNVNNSGSAFRQWAKGIKAATGDIVWIAESDDYCDERFLEVLVRCFDDEAVLLAYAKSAFVDKNEEPIRDDFQSYISDLTCAARWNDSYVETAHNEVRCALGIKNTIPNASSVLFKRPVDMPLLEDESWLSMVVAGDWVFYLHIIRGGKIAYSAETLNYFRRYEGSAAEVTYRKEVFYREVGMSSRTVAALYNVPLSVLELSRQTYRTVYANKVGGRDEEFTHWYDYQSILRAREHRLPNVLISTMGFFPGGAEILPIRLANEFKRQGLSVLLLNAGLNPREDGVRRMLRNDVPVIETSSVEAVKAIICDFGVEVLNTHQWHIQKYPLQVPDVFDELCGHVASLHGMIEYGEAFCVTEEQLRTSDQKVTTWVYTAEKNVVPFSNFGLYDKVSGRFVKVPNGMEPPTIVPVSRAQMNIPQDAFVLCCVSRAIPDKGWAETIQAVERARVLSGRDIRLILVGNGPVYDEYCRDGTPDFVYLAGFSENSVGHYAAADMGIMLTKFKSESFPLTIVDSLFAGKPYIASDVGDIRNMLTIQNSIAGELVGLDNWEIPIERAAQVIAAFATDKKKYLNVLGLVEDVARRYRIDAVAKQYVGLFKNDFDSHRSKSKEWRI